MRNENVLASSNNGKSQPAAIQVLIWSCSQISELESAGSVCQLASRCTCRAAADVQFAVICRSAWGRKLLLLLPVSQLLSRPVSQPASQAVSQSVVSGIDIISRSRFYRSLRSNAPHSSREPSTELSGLAGSDSTRSWQIIVLKEQFIGLLFAF